VNNDPIKPDNRSDGNGKPKIETPIEKVSLSASLPTYPDGAAPSRGMRVTGWINGSLDISLYTPFIPEFS
jgi:hypothetical protein